MKPFDFTSNPVGSPAAQEAIRRARLFPVDSSGGHLFVAFAGGLGALRQINLHLDAEWVTVSVSAASPDGTRLIYRDRMATTKTADEIEDFIGGAKDVLLGRLRGPIIRAERRRAQREAAK